jgi:hypothetical protein
MARVRILENGRKRNIPPPNHNNNNMQANLNASGRGNGGNHGNQTSNPYISQNPSQFEFSKRQRMFSGQRPVSPSQSLQNGYVQPLMPYQQPYHPPSFNNQNYPPAQIHQNYQSPYYPPQGRGGNYPPHQQGRGGRGRGGGYQGRGNQDQFQQQNNQAQFFPHPRHFNDQY